MIKGIRYQVTKKYCLRFSSVKEMNDMMANLVRNGRQFTVNSDGWIELSQDWLETDLNQSERVQKALDRIELDISKLRRI
jgi:hypothetical protein